MRSGVDLRIVVEVDADGEFVGLIANMMRYFLSFWLISADKFSLIIAVEEERIGLTTYCVIIESFSTFNQFVKNFTLYCKYLSNYLLNMCCGSDLT